MVDPLPGEPMDSGSAVHLRLTVASACLSGRTHTGSGQLVVWRERQSLQCVCARAASDAWRGRLRRWGLKEAGARGPGLAEDVYADACDEQTEAAPPRPATTVHHDRATATTSGSTANPRAHADPRARDPLVCARGSALPRARALSHARPPRCPSCPSTSRSSGSPTPPSPTPPKTTTARITALPPAHRAPWQGVRRVAFARNTGETGRRGRWAGAF